MGHSPSVKTAVEMETFTMAIQNAQNTKAWGDTPERNRDGWKRNPAPFYLKQHNF